MPLNLLRHRMHIPEPPLERPSIEDRHGPGHLFAIPLLPHLCPRIDAVLCINRHHGKMAEIGGIPHMREGKM